MIPELDRQLLTAYLDGELSARQSRQALKLLHRSGEARDLFRQLQDNARALRRLRRIHPRPALSDSVLQLIRARQIQPRKRPVAATRRTLPAWAGYAAAAAVLVMVCGASYLFFAETLDQSTNVVADGNGSMIRPKDSGPASPVPPVDVVKVLPREELVVPPRTDNPVEPSPIVKIPGNDAPLPPQPTPEAPKDPSLITAPVTEMVELKMVDIAAPLIVKLRDLDQSKTKTDLLAELNKAGGFRVEFPCRNGTKALERFMAACKANEIALHVDQVAADRMKYPHLRTSYALYLEDLTPEDLTRLLQQVTVEDKKTDPKKAVESQFDRLVLVRLTNRDRKEIADLLGNDPTANPDATGPLGTDLHKPVSDQTGSQIAAVLAGQGGAPPRPEGGKPAAKALEHQALVIPYAPQHPAANSAEVKRYLDIRKAARPGTLQLFLVLREMGA